MVFLSIRFTISYGVVLCDMQYAICRSVPNTLVPHKKKNGHCAGGIIRSLSET